MAGLKERLIALFICSSMVFSLFSCSANKNLYFSKISADKKTAVITNNINKSEVRVNIIKESEINEKSSSDSFANAADFGLSEDENADNMKAIAKAIASLKNGGTVYIPSGTYKIKKQIYIYRPNITICGAGPSTHLIYDFEQKSFHTSDTASFFCVVSGISSIIFRDIVLEYHGEFFPEFGHSYDGKINAINICRSSDILIENVEAFGFNSCAVYVSGTDTNETANDIIIRGCYFHHNRVGGVLYGYVNGLTITDCILEYHGSRPDGGTGYGSAGSSGAYPMNVRVINNQCNYNYRKGIDLHAGENIVIEGNTCRGNRLYGIYCEGPKTNHVVIKNNIVSDMSREKLDIGEPYTWLSGIDVGTATNTDGVYYDFQVIGNIIENHGLVQGSAYGICGYFSFDKGSVIIKDNIFNCTEITNFVRFSGDGSINSSCDISFNVSGNQFYAEKADGDPILISKYNSLIFSDNQISVKKPNTGRVVYINNDALSSTIFTGNNIDTGNSSSSVYSITRTSGTKGLIIENNIVNGSIKN
ncbi:hypothetical protein SDC9_63615 [bioreactor metagenome]|uniref:Uncharacterized protein n=1 Tax=bioreactor metagenome TaxID=1076179 RepID=A0A644XMK6_9ZZZZ|nr:glycosyl hydrolase family 28-related protein [Oscillospiraceae bacterium]